MKYAFIAVFIVAVVIGIIRTSRQNKKIRQGGLEAEAVITRIEEEDTTDADGSPSATFYTYYVTYRTMDGRTVEAKLGSGKSVDNQIGGGWARGLQAGSRVVVSYLPDEPDYVILAKK